MAYEDLTAQQRQTLESLSGVGLPVSGGFGSGQRLPTDPRAIYDLLQWTPPSYSPLLGSVTTPGEPQGYGVFTDLSLYSEAIPRFTGQTNPYGALTASLDSIGNDYYRNMMRTYGNNYFNTLEKEAQRDSRDLWIRRISAAVIAIAAWGAGAFTPTGAEGGSAGASQATVASTHTIDPTYFGFEPGTYSSLGVSEYAFGPQVLAPSAAQSLAGASAFAQPGVIERGYDSFVNNLGSSVKVGTITKPLAELVQAVVQQTGSVGQAIGRIFSGDILGGIRQLFGITPPSVGPTQTGSTFFGSNGGSGGGGASYLSNNGQTQTATIAWLPILLIGGLLLFVLLKRKR